MRHFDPRDKPSLRSLVRSYRSCRERDRLGGSPERSLVLPQRLARPFSLARIAFHFTEWPDGRGWSVDDDPFGRENRRSAIRSTRSEKTCTDTDVRMPSSNQTMHSLRSTDHGILVQQDAYHMIAGRVLPFS